LVTSNSKLTIHTDTTEQSVILHCQILPALSLQAKVRHNNSSRAT
jgi:hypothetical protein